MMFVVSVFLAATVWVIYRPASLTYKNLPFPVVEKRIYRPGEVVPILVNRCSNAPGTNIYTVTRGFNNTQNSRVIVLDSTRAAIKYGCITTVSSMHQIPKDLPPGNYTIVGTTEIQDVFGIKVLNFESESFTVK